MVKSVRFGLLAQGIFLLMLVEQERLRPLRWPRFSTGWRLWGAWLWWHINLALALDWTPGFRADWLGRDSVAR